MNNPDVTDKPETPAASTPASGSEADGGLTVAAQVGIGAWLIGAFMLLEWNWQAAIGFALVKFGAAMLEGDKREKPQNCD